MPTTWEDRVALYCGHLVFDCNVQSATLKSYVSAIKDVLVNDGYPWKQDKMLMSMLISSCQIKNDRVRNRFPISDSLLDLLIFEIIKEYRENQPYLEIMYKNVFLWLYYGLFRVGEVTSGSHPIKAKDIHLSNNKDKLLILLYSSKTHGKESKPQAVKIESLNHGNKKNKKSKRTFCPFKAGREYMAIRGNYSHDNEPYFIFSDGSPLKPYQVRSLLRKILINLSLDPHNYSTHSFRIGRATDLMKRGKDLESIKRSGRWRSNAVYSYLKET